MLTAHLGAAAALVQASAAAAPFAPPFQRLASDPGWVLWLGHPPVPDGIPLLPAPPELLWNDPVMALATAAGVSVAYAHHRREAPGDIVALLEREGPVAVVAPAEIHSSVKAALSEIGSLGIPILYGAEDLAQRLDGVPSFQARRRGHDAAISRLHDPALAGQVIEAVDQIGGNPLSSFVVHAEGERDGVTVIGTFGPRVAIEVGVKDASIDAAGTVALERDVASFPGFLDGVVSRTEGHSLVIGWQEGGQPSAHDLGEVIRAWLKALYQVRLVDVRIAFAPPKGRSALLTDMRARASAYTAYRAALAAESPAPGRSATTR